MSDMNVQVRISADASAMAPALNQGSAALDNFTAVAERMNATLKAGFAQTQMILRSMCSAMGEVGTVADTTTAKVVPDIEKIEKAAEKAKNGFGELGQKLASVGMSLSLALTAPLAAATVGIFEATKKMDSLKLSLTAVAGSAEGMKRQLEDAKEIAKLPGLGMEEAMTGSIRLQSAGISAEQSKKSLMAFGNALATVGKGKAELDGVTLALSQIQSKGKVFAEEINQLNERLPQIRGAMKDAFGTANSEDLQKLGISSEEFIAKVTTSFAKLPSVAGGMQNDMENMTDKWKMALADMGEGLKPFFATALQVFTAVAAKVAELGKWFNGLTENQRGWIVSAVGVAAALGPVLLGVGKAITVMVELKAAFAVARTAMIAMNLTMLANPFVAAAAAIVGVTLAVIGLKSAMDDLAGSDMEQKAARTPEAMAAKKKVESYQYAFDHLSAGKERDEVGRKLGRAKEEMNAVFSKDDATIKNGTTLDMGTGGAGGSAGFDVKGTLAKKGVFERNAPVKKGAKAGVSESHKAELADDEKAFKEAQHLAVAQEKLRIDSIMDEVEREREIRTAKYHEDIEKAKGNKALLLQVNDKFATDLQVIEEKSDAKINAAKLKAMNKEIALQEKVAQAAKDSAEKAKKAHADYIESLKPKFEVIKQVASTISSAFAGIAAKMTDLAVRGDFTLKALGNAFKEMMIGMLADIVSFVAKTMIEVAILATADALTGGIVSAVLGASNGGKGTGGILGFATGGLLSFDVGTPSVPRDMVAQIHQGEMIIPKTFAEGIRNGEVPLGRSASGASKSTSGGSMSASLVIDGEIMDAINRNGKAVVKILRNESRLGFMGLLA